jgi:hypothetical protein
VNSADKLALVGAPIGAVIGFSIGVSHGIWWGILAILPGAAVGFWVGPVLLLLLHIMHPPRELLSGGRRISGGWRLL